MNKSQMIKAVAEKSELSQKQVAETWNLIEATILDTLNAGEKVQLSGFGTFEVRERAERKGRNPKTGEVVSVPACKYLAFVSAKASYDVKVGDIIEVTFGAKALRIRVLEVKETVGKDAASTLYEVVES